MNRTEPEDDDGVNDFGSVVGDALGVTSGEAPELFDASNLFVFSGDDLLTSHNDIADVDWVEVAERTLIDERRGLVVAQAVIIEDVTPTVV